MSNGNEQIDSDELSSSIERGLEFLHRRQLPMGEFELLTWHDLTRANEWVVDSSPFSTALIAYSLSFSDSKEAREMIGRASQFLLAEMEDGGLWRYWPKKHHLHTLLPPDLDDTACASIALRQSGVAFPSNINLISLNCDRRGLFYTWMTPRWPLPPNFAYLRLVLPELLDPVKFYGFWKYSESSRDDIDGVVNANVLFYLGESDRTRPVIDYLIEIVRKRKESVCDKWYWNRFSFYYAISRNFYAGVRAFEVVREEVIARIVEGAGEDGRIGANALDTALAVCALQNWGSAPPALLARAVRFLLDAQGADGEWPAIVFYYGGPKRRNGWGSQELTTGFCLEALLRARSGA
jgi:hypothetical protein